MSERLRATYVSEIIDLLDWARCLDRYGPNKCNPVRRLAIGVYQLHQGVDWQGTSSEYESYAAAAIHICASAESFDIPIEEALSCRVVSDIKFGGGSDALLLYNISKFTSQIVYATNSSSIRRKNRFDSRVAANAAAAIVEMLLGKIPPAKREQAIYEAMEIMVGVL